MPTFRAPMINLYSRDLLRAARFYTQLGFVESFRTPATGDPVHIELSLDGFTLESPHRKRPGNIADFRRWERDA